jgi:Fe-S-cluster containining protein
VPHEKDPMDNPWYHEGLRFRCTQCGKCCTGAPGFVWVNDEELNALAEFLDLPREQVEKLYTRWLGPRQTLREKPGGDCIFYDQVAGCTVYEVRPRQCRTWPFWESNVKTPEDWRETCEICPGSGQGDLIPAEEITRRMKVIRM